MTNFLITKRSISILSAVFTMFTLQLSAQNTGSKAATSSEKKSHKKQLTDALVNDFPHSKLSKDDASKIAYHYLRTGGLKSDSIPAGKSTGSVAFQSLVKDVKQDSALVLGKLKGKVTQKAITTNQDSILVLGTPNDENPTDIELAEAADRMAIKNPNGGNWKFYNCASFHTRFALNGVPQMRHEGLVNMVRVTLPKTKLESHQIIQTPIGIIKREDHLFFSNEELRKYHFNLCFPNGPDSAGVSLYKKLPTFERVDLITPARYDLIRFAPVAIYMVYAKANDATPIFYLMEGGNGLGFCEVLYVSPTMDPNKPILMDAGYRPTSFSNSWNYYLAKTEFLNDDPTFVSIKVYTRKEILTVPPATLGKDSKYHFEIKMQITPSTLEGVADAKHFIHPAKQVVQAFLRLETLKSVGVPLTENTKVERKYTRLSKRLTRRASRGWPHRCLEKRLNKIKLEMSDVLNPKVK